MGDADVPSIFSLANSYTNFSNIRHLTASTSREWNEDQFQLTPVELLWYYTYQVKDNTSIEITWATDAESRQLKDIQTVKRAITSSSCNLSCVEAMVRLATVVRTPGNQLVLTPGIPKTPVTRIAIEANMTKDEAADNFINELILDSSAPTPSPEASSSNSPSSLGPELTKWAFICAYLLRYAYRQPGDNWDLKVSDFKSKFSEMLGMDYNESIPSSAFVVSFNAIAKDLKHKLRIVVHMIIVTTTDPNSIMSDDRAKMYRYLFATPFAYFALSALIQIKKCADILDVGVPEFMSAMTVPELATGISILNNTLSKAQVLSYWPYARAYDDSFFPEMSSLSVKKVHFVCLVIQNMKGGQNRPIDLTKVKAVASVREREQLTEIAAKIVVAIDSSRPETTTSRVLKQLEQGQDFQQKAQRYISSVVLQKGNTINQTLPTFDLSGMLIQK